MLKKTIFLILLLCGNFIMKTQEPFSFKEINALEEFDLVNPTFLRASDGINLAYYSFLDPSNDKIIILYGGAGLYGNKMYQWVAKTLQEKYGIGCYIFDIRGHGHSQGPRGDSSSINRVWLDTQEALEFVKKENPSSKIYLAGHSSGAGLIINYNSLQKDNLAEGYIFLAPYLGPKSNTIKENKNSQESFIKNVRTWVYILGSIFPDSFFIHLNALFFNYPDNILKSDPLILPSYSYAMSAATTPYEIKPLLKKIDKPVGIFIGNNDEQFLPEKVIAIKDMINAPVQAKIIDNAAHLSILLQAPQLISDFIQ